MLSSSIEEVWDSEEGLSEKLDSLGAKFKPEAGKNSLLYIARGKSGNRWYYDPGLGYRRLIDPYAENVPEALIKWCTEFNWKLLVFFEGVAPEFDNIDKPYSERFPGVVQEIYSHDVNPIFPRRNAITDEFEAYYSDHVLSDPKFQKAFSYLDVDFHDTLEDLLDGLPLLSAGHVHSVERWALFLDAIGPKAVFAGRLDIRHDICKACEVLNIMTVGVKLGVAEEMLAPFALHDGDGKFNDKAFPDVLGIWGTPQLELIQSRFPDCSSKLVVCGRTRNDTFSNLEDTADAQKIRDAIGLSDDKKVLTYGANFATKFGKVKTRSYGACCMSPLTYMRYLEALIELCKERGDCVVLVKPHPSDDIGYLKERIEELESDLVYLVTDEAGLHNADILHCSSVFLSSVSSMFSEALLANCPPVSIWSQDVSYLYETGRRDIFDPISITVESEDLMVETINRLLDDPLYQMGEMVRMKGNLIPLFGSNDGHNADLLVTESMNYYKDTWVNQHDDGQGAGMFDKLNAFVKGIFTSGFSREKI